VHIHAIGVPERVTLIVFELERPEEPQAAQEQEVPTGEGFNEEDLPKFPDHQPSSFLKGQPRSIISLFVNDNLVLVFDALCNRNELETLAAYTVLV
jgi:hypothetical protein